jgi:hypothetical protein
MCSSLVNIIIPDYDTNNSNNKASYFCDNQNGCRELFLEYLQCSYCGNICLRCAIIRLNCCNNKNNRNEMKQIQRILPIIVDEASAYKSCSDCNSDNKMSHSAMFNVGEYWNEYNIDMLAVENTLT